MALNDEDVARAFSSHDFEAAYPHLADDISWNPVGAPLLEGKEAVKSACQDSAGYLANVETNFHSFRVITSEDAVVVDTVADYTDPDRTVSRVASCDIYRFVDGKVAEITSYNIELSDPQANASA